MTSELDSQHEKDAHVIDGRTLEPPEPFVLTMEALDTLPPGQPVLLLLGREPHPLYRALELNGHTWKTTLADDGTVEILILRPADRAQ